VHTKSLHIIIIIMQRRRKCAKSSATSPRIVRYR